MFEGLSFGSAGYGLLDFIHGRDPPFACTIDRSITMKFATTIASEEQSTNDGTGNRFPVTPSLTLTFSLLGPCEELVKSDVDGTIVQKIQSSLTQLIGASTIGSDNSIGLVSVLRSVDALKGPMHARIRLTKLKLKCLGILLHAKSISDRVQIHLKSDSQLLRDVVALADLSSEALAELQLDHPISLAKSALDTCVSLLKVAAKRRGSLLSVGIDRVLGLNRSGDDSVGGSDSGGAGESPWMSIVLAAVSELSARVVDVDAFVDETRPSVSSTERLPVLPYDNKNGYAKSLPEKFEVVTYYRTGLELLASYLQQPDAFVASAPVDSSVVNSVGGLLPTCIPLLNSIDLLSMGENGSESFSPPTSAVSASSAKNRKLTGEMRQLVWAVSLTIQCLDLCFKKRSHVPLIQECGALGAVTEIVKIFVNKQLIVQPTAGIPAETLVENSISFLKHSVEQAARGTLLRADTGLEVLFDPMFSVLCCQIFTSFEGGNDCLWYHTLQLIRTAIKVQPAFLGHFLRTPAAQALKAFLKNHHDREEMMQISALAAATSAATSASVSGTSAATTSAAATSATASVATFKNRAYWCEELVLASIAQLGKEMCLTADGKAFVRDSELVLFVLKSITSAQNLLPHSLGITGATLKGCGNYVAKILREQSREHPAAYERWCHKIRTAIISICERAQQLEYSVASTESSETAVEYSSVRMQVLQQLENICKFVENLQGYRGDDRRLFREILNQKVITALAMTYRSTLPPPRQLLAQLSLRSPTGLMVGYVGQSSVTKSLTSLVHIVTTITPDSVLPILFRTVDKILSELSIDKQALIASTVLASGSSGSSGVEDLNPADGIGGAAGGKGGFSISPMDISTAPDESITRMTSRQHRRARSSSYGKQPSVGNVHILGVLDSIPHSCVFTSEFTSKVSPDFLPKLWRFLGSVMALEWTGTMLSNGFRTLQRGHGMNQLSEGKDVMRRMFAFHRSALMEVCRFAASKWDSAVRTLECLFFQPLFKEFFV